MPSNPSHLQPGSAFPPSLIVHAQLSGAKSVVLRLLIDTGATCTMIPLKAAMATGCDPSLSTRRLPVITASAVEYPAIVTIPRLNCLGQRFVNVDVVCHDLPPQSAVDGLLGLNVLMHLLPFHRFIHSIRTHLVNI